MGPLGAGEAVRVFYHMTDHPHGYRYVRLLDGPAAPAGTPEGRAAIGLSTGWIPATVHEDWRAEAVAGSVDDRVLVNMHGRFMDAYNQEGEPVNGMFWKVKRSLVRLMGSPSPQAELSLVVVRWWDYWNRKNKSSPSHNVANEQMLLDVLQNADSPHATLAAEGRYEVHSVFARSSADLGRVGGELAQAMRGKRRAGLYFLWPTQRPAVERRQAGCVSEPALLDLMRRMEAESIQTCWPHPSGLYRELAGKLWPAKVCQAVPNLCVPPTVRIDLSAQPFPDAAAEKAIAELQAMRKEMGGTPVNLNAPYRGVVKLGFSWMGEDVRPFSGKAELVKVLLQFMDGQSSEAVCLVQERVEDVVCELRMFCFRDMAAGPNAVAQEFVRMKMKAPNRGDDNFALTGHMTMTESETIDSVFSGNKAAYQSAEKEVRTLATRWLQWFKDEGHGMPASCRLDFIVSRGRGASQPTVWTTEVTECGSSLCGLPAAPRTAAVLNACLEGADVAGFPRRLPPTLPVNDPPPQRPPPSTGTQHRGRGGGGSAARGAVQRGASVTGGTPASGKRIFFAAVAAVLAMAAAPKRQHRLLVLALFALFVMPRRPAARRDRS